jgi:hypothetical protein
MLIDNLSHQSQHTAYDISYYHLSRLRRRQPPAHLLYALNELCGVSSLELAYYAQE